VEIVAGVEAIPVTLKRWSAAPAARRAVLRYDVAVDFQGLIKAAALAWASGAPERYGFDRDAIREKPALLFTNRQVAVDRSRHVIDWNLDLARAILPAATMPTVDFTPFASDTRLPTPDTPVVLLPGAGKREKQWPIERFRELAARLGSRALAVWGPGEEELAARIGCRIAPRTNLRELAGILRHAEVVVGGDTGPLHLAAALGTKVVGLYGPTDPRRNGPYGQLHRCVSTFETTKSMDSIGVDDVMELI
jgi:heptosyltransferase-1